MPPHILEAVKAVARMEHRSLSAQVVVVLEETLRRDGILSADRRFAPKE